MVIIDASTKPINASKGNPGIDIFQRRHEVTYKIK